MKLFWVPLSLLVVSTAFMQLVASLSSPDMTFGDNVNGMTSTASIKQPEDESYTMRSLNKETHLEDIHLEDYHLIDPAPSSTANITSGPIEHGTPLIPHIPKPTPPNHPNQNSSTSPPSRA